jgi:hypothetical protein
MVCQLRDEPFFVVKSVFSGICPCYDRIGLSGG